MTEDRDKICREALEGIVDPGSLMRRLRIAAAGVEREMAPEPDRLIGTMYCAGKLGIHFQHGEVVALYHIVKELRGETPEPDIPEGIRTCGHSLMTGYRFVPMGMRAKDAGMSPADIEHILNILQGEPTTADEARLCRECEDTLPSMVQRRGDHGKKRKADAEKRDDERIEKLQGLLDLKGHKFRCEQCDEMWEEGDLIQVRWCTHCEAAFNGSDNGPNCENCNRPFTRKITDSGCPDCIDGENEEGCAEMAEAEIQTALDEARAESGQ